MRDEYPELLATVLPGIRRVHSATVAALQKLEDAIETAADEEPPIVFQRGGGDCVVATIATVRARLPIGHVSKGQDQQQHDNATQLHR